MIIIALVSVDEVAHPRDVFTHRKARNTSTSLLLTLECSPEMKVSDVVQHKEQQSVVGRKQTTVLSLERWLTSPRKY